MEDWKSRYCIYIKVDIVIHKEGSLSQTPTIIRNFSVYYMPNKSIAAAHLIEHLRKDKIISEDNSISYYLKNKDAYIFRTVVPKSGNYLANEEEI